MDELRVFNFIPCLEIGRAVRYSLHDVFRALPFVPQYFYLFLEFEADEAFRFAVRVISLDGDTSYETEEFELKSTGTRLVDWAGELPAKVAGLLPGRYTIEVVDEQSGVRLSSRTVFFGEM